MNIFKIKEIVFAKSCVDPCHKYSNRFAIMRFSLTTCFQSKHVSSSQLQCPLVRFDPLTLN